MAADRYLTCDTSTKVISWDASAAPSSGSAKLVLERSTDVVSWATAFPPLGYSMFSLDSATDVVAWFALT